MEKYKCCFYKSGRYMFARTYEANSYTEAYKKAHNEPAVVKSRLFIEISCNKIEG